MKLKITKSIILPLVLSLITTGLAFSQACPFTVVGYDSFGDGWGTGTLGVTYTVNPCGLADVPPVDPTAGGGLGTFSVPALSGDCVDFNYTAPGIFASESSYVVYDCLGNTVAPAGSYVPGGPTPHSSMASTLGVCAPAVPANSCVYELCIEDSFGDGWCGTANLTVTTTGCAVNNVTNVYRPEDAAGEVCIPMYIEDGCTVTLSYDNTGNTFASEVGYTLTDPSGAPVVDYPAGTITGNQTDAVVAVCPPAAVVTMLECEVPPLNPCVFGPCFNRYGDASLKDPCGCLNPLNLYDTPKDNGTPLVGFHELVTITGVGVFTIVSVVGDLGVDNCAAPFTPTIVPGAVPGTFEIELWHAPGVGYTIQVTDGVTIYEISNVCEDNCCELECPEDEVFVLDPGDCDYIYEFELCPAEDVPMADLVGPCGFDEDILCASINSLSCNGGFPPPTNEYITYFGPTNVPALVTEICFATPTTYGGGGSFTIQVYDQNTCGAVPLPPFSGSGCTPLVVADTTIAATGCNIHCITLDTVTLDGTEDLYISIFTTAPFSYNTPPECADGSAATGNGTWIVAPACGLAAPSLFSGIGFALDGMIQLNYAVPPAPSDPDAPVSGDPFPVGCQPLEYTVFDLNGDSATCSWEVCVESFPDPAQSLACNDKVNISVNTDCEMYITADIFLEGGPYGCYLTDYAVYFSDNPGVDVNDSTFSLPLGTYTATVEDLATGNTCWSEFVIEDKEPPVIECRPFTINCLEYQCGSIPKHPVPGAAGTETIVASDPFPVVLNGNSTVTLTVDATSLPVGSVITDLNVVLAWSDTAPAIDIDDIDWSIQSTSVAILPLATSSYPDPFNSNFNAAFDFMNTIMDAEGPLPTGIADGQLGTNLFFDNDNANLTAFYGTPANEVFTLTAVNFFGSDIYNIDNFALEITYDAPEIGTVTTAADGTITYTNPDADNCGTVTLECSDLDLDFQCQGSVVFRTWVATDAAGNTASCTQQIIIEGISFDDITGTAGEILDDGIPTGADPVALGEIRLPASVVTKLSCGDDTTPQGIYETCAEYSPDPISTACDQALGEVTQHNRAVMASFPHTIKTIPHPGGNSCTPSTVSYLVPLGDEFCNFIIDYQDIELPACTNGGGNCPGNKKVIRTWTILDWCANQTTEYQQIIKATDSEAPTFVQATDAITLSANPWGCVASGVLPDASVHDNCDYEVDYTVTTGEPGVSIIDGVIYNVPKTMPGAAPVQVQYTATDCCGNETVHILEVTVVDGTPPVPIAKQNIVLSLTTSPNQNSDDSGVAKLYVGSVDNGSHDGDCGPVRIAIRRNADAPDCGNLGAIHSGAPFNNNTAYFNFDNLIDSQQPTNHDQHDTDEGQFVKFCCIDLTEGGVEHDFNSNGVAYGVHEVWLGVWDDANMDGVPGTSGDNFNETWVHVRVETKIDPVIFCPPMAMVECTDDPTDPGTIESTLGSATAGGLCSSVGVAYVDVCDADLDGDGDIDAGNIVAVMGGAVLVNEKYNKACNYGPITRTWFIDLDGDGEQDDDETTTCTQIVIVKAPAALFDGCEDTNILWPYEDSNDQVFDANGTAVGFDDNCIGGYAEVGMACAQDFDTEVSWVAENCSLIGHTVDSTIYYFEGDACLKIIYEHSVIDWCQYEHNFGNSPDGDTNGNGVQDGIWRWTVIAKVIDDTAPEIQCEEQCYAVQPECVTSVTLTAVAHDSLSDCPSEWIKWTVIVDLWGDFEGPCGGNADYEWSSFVPEDRTVDLWDDDNGNGICDIRLGNQAGNPDNLDIGQFATAPGEQLDVYIPEPVEGWKGDHRLIWKAYDGCGNVTSKTTYFQVVDKKPPTPYCVNLSTALMENGEVELWACDFDRGSFDNCSPQDWLRYSFGDPDTDYPSAEGAAENYLEDSRCTSKTFTCDDFNNSAGGIVLVKMYVYDECDNYDFCEVTLRLVDNQGACPPIGTREDIGGNINTEDGRGITNADVQLLNVYDPSDVKNTMSDAGHYTFRDEYMYLDYDITAEKNDDYLNGVSTLDLVLIQRHILGLSPLDSGYKMIAADINSDENISSIDLIELRKLILGIYDELPDNGSWRFADANQNISLSTPWPFAEVLSVVDLQNSMMDEDFVGIKIGDVNGTVTLSLNGTTVDSRNRPTVTFAVEDRTFKAGEEFDIAFTSDNFNDVSGYQFTLDASGLELVNVKSGAINVEASNFASIGNSITSSWNTEKAVTANDVALFTLTVRATANGTVSQALNMNSNITSAEAYLGDSYELANVALRDGDADVAYALYQNEPNPFSDNTVIGFMLPSDAAASISVYDVTGKVLKTINGDFVKGYNTVELSKSDVATVSGVLYYKLESGDYTMTKKMIIIE